MKIVLGNHSFRGMAALWAAMITLGLLASGCAHPDDGSQPDDDTPLSSAKAITSFRFTNPAATGDIDEMAKTISITLPYGTPVNSLTPVITVSSGATVSPRSGTAQDFSSPVSYTVRAEDGTTETYAVTVTVAPPPGTAKAITGFRFTSPEATGDIDEAAKTISITLPYGTAVNSLTPVITISAMATVSPSSETAQDFSSPVTYTVRAEDGTTETYTVTVTVEKQGQADITLNLTDVAREALSGGGITIAKTSGTYKQTETLTVVGTFDRCKWRVDGTVKGTGNSLILDAGDYAEGTHQVSLEVSLKGIPYSKAGTFTVVQ
jgi:hypothetical protein